MPSLRALRLTLAAAGLTCALFAVPSSAPAADMQAARASRPVVTCAGPRIVSHPQSCTVYGPPGSNKAVQGTKLRWSSWGPGTAVAHGMVSNPIKASTVMAATFRFSRLRPCGDELFYTKVRVTTAKRTTTVTTPGCPATKQNDEYPESVQKLIADWSGKKSYPVRCTRFAFSSVDRTWTAVAFNGPAAATTPECAKRAYDGASLLHLVDGTWRGVVDGSDVPQSTCAKLVPAAVIRSLKSFGPCY